MTHRGVYFCEKLGKTLVAVRIMVIFNKGVVTWNHKRHDVEIRVTYRGAEKVTKKIRVPFHGDELSTGMWITLINDVTWN